MNFDSLCERAYKCAIKRNKLDTRANYNDMVQSLNNALKGETEEFCNAQGLSKHLHNRSEYAEELADVVITAMTISKAMGIHLMEIIEEKIAYNEKRKD